MNGDVPTFDVAFSFSGAQRPLVEPVVKACKAEGLDVFYDQDNTLEFWGRNFIYGMRQIYGGTRARYFVPFLSQEYLNGAYPMDEFQAATRRAIESRDDGYILPVIVGSVAVPPELLDPAIGYLRLEDYTAEDLASAIAGRVGVARRRLREPREITEVLEVRLPRLAPVDFSPYELLEAALARVGDLFESNAQKLTPFGLRCSVRRSDSELKVRVDRSGDGVYGLRLWFDDSHHDDRIAMAFGLPRLAGGTNGWVTAVWDPDSREPRLRFSDLSYGHGQEPLLTADQVFHRLWGKVMDHLDQLR